MVQITNQV